MQPACKKMFSRIPIETNQNLMFYLIMFHVIVIHFINIIEDNELAYTAYYCNSFIT